METVYGVKEPTVVNPRATTPDWGTFTQKLDHFNPFDERTWEMVKNMLINFILLCSTACFSLHSFKF